MRESDPKSTPWPSAVAGILLLLAAGTGYRLLAAHYARPAGSVQIPHGTLASLPFEIGDWTGFDEPLDEQVIRATDTDDHLNRVYRRRGGGAVGLFVGYGFSLRDLAPHRPEVCYPGAGWAVMETRQITDTAADGTELPVQVHQFRRGGLLSERVTVLNYYIVDGQNCADVSLLRSRAWRRNTSATYAAQVQIVAGGADEDGKSEELVRAFGVSSAPVIRALLSSAVEAAVATTDDGSG